MLIEALAVLDFWERVWFLVRVEKSVETDWVKRQS